jgi:hypothetical protein
VAEQIGRFLVTTGMRVQYNTIHPHAVRGLASGQQGAGPASCPGTGAVVGEAWNCSPKFKLRQDRRKSLTRRRHSTIGARQHSGCRPTPFQVKHSLAKGAPPGANVRDFWRGRQIRRPSLDGASMSAPLQCAQHGRALVPKPWMAPESEVAAAGLSRLHCRVHSKSCGNQYPSGIGHG